MSTREEIEQFGLQVFAFLQNEYGFNLPKVRKEAWVTRIDFIGEKIAIELEIDWREVDVFLLIVQLEAGKLPKGYYVSNGKKCRVHLLTLVQEKKWAVDQAIISQIRSQQAHSVNELIPKIEAYSELLYSCLTEILAEGEALFR